MEKKLPRMYHQDITKDICNTQKIYSSLDNDLGVNHSKEPDRFTIDKKIYDIFNSLDYVYKADVTIITKDNILNRRIIGRTKNDLITIDNEKIPIKNIMDIYKP